MSVIHHDGPLLYALPTMDKDIFLAGVCIDPMYCVILKEDQRSIAKAALCNIAIKMKGLALQEESLGETLCDSMSTRSSDDESLESEEIEDDVELILKHDLDIQEQNKRQRLKDGKKKIMVW